MSKFSLKYALTHEHQPANSPAVITLEVEAVDHHAAISQSGRDLHEAYPDYEILLTDCRPLSATEFKNEFAGKVSKK